MQKEKLRGQAHTLVACYMPVHLNAQRRKLNDQLLGGGITKFYIIHIVSIK